MSKSAQGSQEWRRLFALMSSAIARLENGLCVPNTPENVTELREELRELANQLDAVRTLGAYRATLNYVGTLKDRSSKYFIMRQAGHQVFVQGYAANQSQAANLAYTQLESNKNRARISSSFQLIRFVC